MKNIKSKIFRIISFTLCASILFVFLSSACERKKYYGAWNYTAKLNEFYSLEKDTLDYIGVGSSHMYCTLNPLEVWHESGAAGFLLATQQQPLMASYHYIKEALKTQSPRYVILEGYMVCRESAHDSAVLYDAIDPLAPSWNKFQMINHLVEYDQRPEYYFNILKYHTRWNTVSAEQIELLFNEPVDTYKGFVPITGKHSGQNLIPDYEVTADTELSEYNINILNNIYDLVTDHGAELIVMFGPYDAASPELCQKIKAEIQWAQERNIAVLDYCAMLDELRIDPTSDYYDAGHLDVSGAAKISAHFAVFLSENGVSENTKIDNAKWEADYKIYLESFPNDTAS